MEIWYEINKTIRIYLFVPVFFIVCDGANELPSQVSTLKELSGSALTKNLWDIVCQATPETVDQTVMEVNYLLERLPRELQEKVLKFFNANYGFHFKPTIKHIHTNFGFELESCEYSSDLKYMVRVDENAKIHIHDLQTLEKKIIDQNNLLSEVQFFPQTHLFACIRESAWVDIYDAQSAILTHSISIVHRAQCVACSQDGILLAIGLANGSIIVWNLPDNKLQTTLNGHNRPVNGLYFIKNNQLASTSNNELRIWKVEDATTVHQLPLARTEKQIRISPDGKQVASYSSSLNIIGITIRNLENATSQSFSEPVCNKLFYSPDGKYLIAFTEDFWDRSKRKLKMWNVKTMQPQEIALPNEHTYQEVFYSNELIPDIACNTDYIKCVKMSPDSRYLLVGSASGKVYVFETQTGKLVCDHQISSNVIGAMLIGPDNSQFIVEDSYNHYFADYSKTLKEYVLCKALLNSQDEDALDTIKLSQTFNNLSEQQKKELIEYKDNKKFNHSLRGKIAHALKHAYQRVERIPGLPSSAVLLTGALIYGIGRNYLPLDFTYNDIMNWYSSHQ